MCECVSLPIGVILKHVLKLNTKINDINSKILLPSDVDTFAKTILPMGNEV